MKTIFVVTMAASALLFMTQLVPGRGFGGAHGGFGRSQESFDSRSRGGGFSDGVSGEGGFSDGRRDGGGENGGFHANAERSGSDFANGGQAGRTRTGNTEDRGGQQSSRYSNGSAEGVAASDARNNNQNPQPSGAEGAAAGAAAANRNEPSYSGVQGAAAGAAAVNRHEPSYSGAQGAAAGAAAANRNQPSYSGKQGAAAGAAVANRNAPAYSGAQGAAAGAAVANRNAPAYSGAQGAAAGYAAGVGAAGKYQGGSVGLPTDAGYGMLAAGAGAVAANHETIPINGTALAAGGAAIRSSYAGAGAFNQGWYGTHPGAWTAAGWTASTAWSPATFAGVVSALGRAGNVQPVSYDYGTNVTYQGDQVYYGNQPVATAEQYYQQAAALAQNAPPGDAQATDWMPLGVFALVKSQQDRPHYVVQLAVDKSGTIAGNYCDLVSDTVHPIHGSVDKNTQRVAWMVGSNSHTVGEVGLQNLTQDEAPVLIHIGQNKTQQWMLVRLKQPAR